VAIMQPTYLPWLGYFDMMARVDVFVLLDNVQFEKASWQQRNRIKTSQGELMLTIPVRKGPVERLIADTEINLETRFGSTHAKSLQTAYGKAPFAEYLPGLTDLVKSGIPLLGPFTTVLIRWLADQMGITTRIILGSELDATGRRTELTVNQCRELGASHYLAAGGSREYTSQEPGFAAHGIAVEYHAYAPPEYPQLHGPFLPYLSAVDALLNVGPGTRALLTA
jgi:hypothetical protein